MVEIIQGDIPTTTDQPVIVPKKEDFAAVLGGLGTATGQGNEVCGTICTGDCSGECPGACPACTSCDCSCDGNHEGVFLAEVRI